MHLALYCAKMYGVSLSEALTQAWKVAKLKKMLRKHKYFKFSYFKKDGSIREACGTLEPSVMEYAICPLTGRSYTCSKPDVIRYYDQEAEQFRSFKALNLI